ncbi:hypothetical protein [Luteimonas salinilitoris]|uniref:Uncharacterized protein n=1 Tax=Luteimonas salinilitoris TaxID=3237697 RepID=A0ABV4HNG6_9GAMM
MNRKYTWGLIFTVMVALPVSAVIRNVEGHYINNFTDQSGTETKAKHQANFNCVYGGGSPVGNAYISYSSAIEFGGWHAVAIQPCDF